jgi:hypothetical protein
MGLLPRDAIGIICFNNIASIEGHYIAWPSSSIQGQK